LIWVNASCDLGHSSSKALLQTGITSDVGPRVDCHARNTPPLQTGLSQNREIISMQLLMIVDYFWLAQG